MSVMMRQIMTLFDEYQSKENAKHTLRAMNENARQGYWNGSRPPIGYCIVIAGQRGSKVKKKLEIDPIHADTVRLIYRLALTGDPRCNGSPMGIKSITAYLNGRNIRTRDGGRWGIASVHQILTRTTYIGEHRFNTRDHKTRAPKPEAEHAIAQVPAIITESEFRAVQANLKARSPQWTPPREVSGPTLLTGICFCANCGGAHACCRIERRSGGERRSQFCTEVARHFCRFHLANTKSYRQSSPEPRRRQERVTRGRSVVTG
jgi:site-specific DNA recombinase